jgi:hypothetical protein
MMSNIFKEWLLWLDRQIYRPIALTMDNFSAHRAAVDELDALLVSDSSRLRHVKVF